MASRKQLTTSVDAKPERPLVQKAEPLVMKNQVNGPYSHAIRSTFFWEKILISENGEIVNKAQYNKMIETLADRAIAESQATARAELDELFGKDSPKP